MGKIILHTIAVLGSVVMFFSALTIMINSVYSQQVSACICILLVVMVVICAELIKMCTDGLIRAIKDYKERRK